jgi:peptidoglycan/xylan/chitin deacetylase (PgdA/CDA1 family)
VALTFDDGPDPTWTPKVLAILAHEHVRATFCLIGRQARRYPDLVRAIKAGGHLLCNHTEHHAQHLDTAPRQVVQAELAAAQASIRVGAGRVPRLFRAPYGAISDVVLAEARAQHMRVLLWDVDPSDWTRPSTGTVISRVLHGVRPGSVVLLHDGGGDRAPTVGALPAIIHGLRAAHYRFALP